MQAICSKHVYLDCAHPDEEATLLIEGERIAEVLPGRDCAGVPGGKARDFGEAFLCPGFHDAHQHVFHTALFSSNLALACAGASEQDCVRQLRAFAANRPAEGWLIGQGWRPALWDPPLAPTRASLDAAFPNRPVCLCAGDLHTIWLNSAGLAALGITDETKPPAGGSFDRDAEGHLTGVLREAAGMRYVSRVFAALPQSEVRRIYSEHFERCLSLGVTSVCDMALCAVPGADFVNEDVYTELLDEGSLPVRCHLFPQNVGEFARVEGLRERLRGPMLRVCGTKQFFDGVSSAHTAWMEQPYANPRFEGDCGRPTVDPELMRQYVLGAASRGIATRIHTIADKAIHCAIQIFAEALERYGAPQGGRHSIEHVESPRPDDLAEMARIGLVASVQPQHIVIDSAQPARDLGEQRASFMWPFASYLSRGVPMAFGTDSPCVPLAPMEVLSCAVTREEPASCEPRGGWLPGQRISMTQAIDAFTRGSAWVVGRERELGRLAPGMLADLVVLDRNLMQEDPEQLQDTEVLASYVGGRLAWER